VTYFWNGNKSGYINHKLETYVEIPSHTLPFDQQPEMKAWEITQKTIELLKSGQYQFGRLNFPNGDMVGHTGSLDATIKAVETIDVCVKELLGTIENVKGTAIILADHGNAEEMIVENKGEKWVRTSHTLNPVPFAIVDSEYKGEYRLSKNVDTPGLSNVAATISPFGKLSRPN